MHTYQVEIGKFSGDNWTDEQDIQNELIKNKVIEVLANFDQESSSMSEVMQTEISKLFYTEKERRSNPYLLFAALTSIYQNPRKKSYSVSVIMKGRNRYMHVFATYLELKTLKEAAALQVSKKLRSSEDLKKLIADGEIPSVLMSDVAKFIAADKWSLNNSSNMINLISRIIM